MKNDPLYHNRRSIRLRGYDYSLSGIYFITICTHDRACLFGGIHHGKMILNEEGQIAFNEWYKTFELRKNMEPDVFMVMPNHIHGIVVITPYEENACRGVLHTPHSHNMPASHHTSPVKQKVSAQNNKTNNNQGVCNTPLRSPSANIGAMVRGYKSSVTKQINQFYHCNGFAVWQRNYYDHIIRDAASYFKISNYIKHNPETWEDDILFKERYHEKRN
jgi:putative transposase